MTGTRLFLDSMKSIRGIDVAVNSYQNVKSMHGALAFPQRTNCQLPNIKPVYMVSSLSIRIFDRDEKE